MEIEDPGSIGRVNHLYLFLWGFCERSWSPLCTFFNYNFRYRLRDEHLQWFCWGYYSFWPASSNLWKGCRSELIERDKFISHFMENDRWLGMSISSFCNVVQQKFVEIFKFIFLVNFTFTFIFIVLGTIGSGIVSLIPCLTGSWNSTFKIFWMRWVQNMAAFVGEHEQAVFHHFWV
jgi:hypothetical protein